MKIGPVNNQPVQNISDDRLKSKRTERESNQPGDRVDISLEGRRRLAELADRQIENQPLSDNISTDHNERLELIRTRIETGFYERLDIKAKIAEKIAFEIENELPDEAW